MQYFYTWTNLITIRYLKRSVETKNHNFPNRKKHLSLSTNLKNIITQTHRMDANGTVIDKKFGGAQIGHRSCAHYRQREQYLVSSVISQKITACESNYWRDQSWSTLDAKLSTPVRRRSIRAFLARPPMIHADAAVPP